VWFTASKNIERHGEGRLHSFVSIIVISSSQCSADSKYNLNTQVLYAAAHNSESSVIQGKDSVNSISQSQPLHAAPRILKSFVIQIKESKNSISESQSLYDVPRILKSFRTNQRIKELSGGHLWNSSLRSGDSDALLTTKLAEVVVLLRAVLSDGTSLSSVLEETWRDSSAKNC